MDAEKQKTLMKKWIVYGGYLLVLSGILAAAVMLALSSDSSTDDIGLFEPYWGTFLAVIFFVPVLAAEFDLFYYLRYVWIQGKPGDETRNRINKISAKISLAALASLPLGFLLVSDWLFLLAFIWALCYPIFRIITCMVWGYKEYKN